MRQCKSISTHHKGMTLIEVLIAIAIASTLAIAGFRAITALIDSASHLSQTAQRWQLLEAAFSAIERAYRRAQPGGQFTLDSSQLALMTVGENGQVIALRFRAQPEIMTDLQFAAWVNNHWQPSYHGNAPPQGLRLTAVTLQGDIVERIYAH